MHDGAEHLDGHDQRERQRHPRDNGQCYPKGGRHRGTSI
jgi:hypothetical protein